MSALAPAHPSLRALALDVEAALASLSRRLDTRLDLLEVEARSLGPSPSASTSSPRLIHRRPVLPYAPDTPPLSAPLREETLREDEEQRRRVAEVLTPGSSVNDGGVGGGVEEGEPEGGDKCMPIAIVGMGCRFPQEATSPEKLWEMLYNKRHARTEVPKDRFNVEAFYHPDADRSGSVSF